MTPDKNDHWLVRRTTIRLLVVGFLIILALTVLADLVIEPKDHFGIDGTLGFYAWFGFAVCVAMVVGARLLGLFLKRPDDHYGD